MSGTASVYIEQDENDPHNLADRKRKGAVMRILVEATPEDAQLIAVAPDLYAACKEMFDEIQNQIGYRLDSVDAHERNLSRVMRRAAAAIAKAEGRSG